MDTQLSNTLAAIFATQHDAREAIKDLHKAGYKQTWLGTTMPADAQTGQPMVQDPGGLARFISSGDQMPLHKALLAHGVSESQAEQIEEEIAPGCSIVTVYGEDNPQRAYELFETHRGQIVGSDYESPSAVGAASAAPRTGVPKDEKKIAERERDVKDPKAGQLRTKADEDEDRDIGRNADGRTGEFAPDYRDYPEETFVERSDYVGRVR